MKSSCSDSNASTHLALKVMPLNTLTLKTILLKRTAKMTSKNIKEKLKSAGN